MFILRSAIEELVDLRVLKPFASLLLFVLISLRFAASTLMYKEIKSR